jgi:hypothetical protein
MEKFLVLVVVLLFIYNLLKPNKKKQGKGTSSTFQDLQKLLSNIEQQNKTVHTKTENKKIPQKKQNTAVKTEDYTSLEQTNIEVKTYDDDISLAEYLETKKRAKGFEDLEESELYTDDDIKDMDTDVSFKKEDEKWLNQSIKDNADHPDKHIKKVKFSAKDIKNAYITNQILEKKYF